jgi:hypothetical protein
MKKDLDEVEERSLEETVTEEQKGDIIIEHDGPTP